MPTPRSSTSPVSGSDDPSLRRLGEIVRDTIAQIFGGNPFLPRHQVRPPLIAPQADGSPAKLEWGVLNRVVVTATGVQRSQLPQIRPEWVGAPLLIAFSVPTGTGARPALVAGGVNLLRAVPRVNNSATGIIATGFRTAMTDGLDWAVY
jgi:hypothetical protein